LKLRTGTADVFRKLCDGARPAVSQGCGNGNGTQGVVRVY